MAFDHRSLIGEGIDTTVRLEKSPAVEGFIRGFKAALLGAPVGAAANAIRGGSAVNGALVGALIPGIIAGLARASSQKLENLETEAELRYHTNNIKAREPMFFMPPPAVLSGYFSRRLGKN